MIGRVLFATFLSCALAAPDADAEAGFKPKPRAAKRGKKKRRGGRGFFGQAVPARELRVDDLPRASGDVWLYAINFKEERRLNIYDDAGQLDDEALAQLDSQFRCKRTGEVRAVDPRLYEVLSLVYDRFQGKRIELVSGFRYQQNENSRHYHGAAMDISIIGVPLKELHEFAKSLDRGGMGIGIYPRAGFVHIDFRAPGEPSYRWTDRSRAGQGNKRGKRPNREFLRDEGM